MSYFNADLIQYSLFLGMTQIEQIKERIFLPLSRREFDQVALSLFAEQYKHVAPYKTYCDLLGKSPDNVLEVDQIPFIPIGLFKDHKILHAAAVPEGEFISSGTTGTAASVHLVPDLRFYKRCFSEAFTRRYGPVEQYVVLALLPSYLERTGSSLVYMANSLIEQSGHAESGFYLDQLDALRKLMHQLGAQGKRILLLGVSYALLDLAQLGPWELPANTIIMETGGMKGKRAEWTKAALHQALSAQFGLNTIHSEYGMTELMSQAYALSEGRFQAPPWMRVLTRDPEDPLSLVRQRTGGINIIDLANVYSCAFIGTQDLGKINSDGSFYLLGRFDHSDIRGCNLLLEA